MAVRWPWPTLLWEDSSTAYRRSPARAATLPTLSLATLFVLGRASLQRDYEALLVHESLAVSGKGWRRASRHCGDYSLVPDLAGLSDGGDGDANFAALLRHAIDLTRAASCGRPRYDAPDAPPSVISEIAAVRAQATPREAGLLLAAVQ